MLKHLLFTMSILIAAGILNAQQEKAYESKYLSIPDPDSCKRNLFILTQEPHIAGSKDDSLLAVFVKDRFERYGIPSEILTYYVYLPYPMSETLEITEPHKEILDLNEKGWEWDKDTHNSQIVLPFNAYSPSGDITGQVVYANYGLPEDYKILSSLGIDVRGKIMLVRYGKSFRGIKVKVAEENGAAGVIIYSDPADDGYVQGDIYPRGPMRPWSAVQRGSIQDLTVYPGDPLTPGYASTKDAKRIPLNDVKDIPKIPCIPISYANAQKLLTGLAGPVVPHDWQGGLPLTYHIGPGGTEVHLKLVMDYEIRPIWDVIGTIRGSLHPEQKVILGNHRDAWVYGAVDPNSGTASLLETARGFGELLKGGWRPERTILLCSWDGEEYGLIGSTEWGEQRSEELSKDAVAYINIDAPVSGRHFGSSSVPSLDKFIMDVTKSVTDPKTGKSVFESWFADQNKKYYEEHHTVPETALTKLGRLGSGSDFTVFLEHIGIPSFDFGFGGQYGVYHSMLDDFYWMEHWGDPTFEYHATVARVLGISAMRMADDKILPLRYSDYARAIIMYLHERQKSAREVSDLEKVSFDSVFQAAGQFELISHYVDSLITTVKLNDKQVAEINNRLMRAERLFILKDGIPKSDWFKHAIYAPGFYTGYASQPLPGIARAIEAKNADSLRKQLSILTNILSTSTENYNEIKKIIVSD
ncbi:MAG: M28 family metallopeptidase [Candidatus Kryptoniota bacterium]